MTSPSVAILGSGPSGLAAAKATLEHGLRPVVFEAEAQPGGMWGGPGRGAWSDFARTNISRYGCAFSDCAWPEDSDVFPVRRDVVLYLRRYADSFDLLPHVQFGTRVVSIRSVDGGRWLLAWSDADGQGEAVFDHVVVGSGFFTEPFTPAFPGLADFAGEVFHSGACGQAAVLRARCAGKRVLVVGAAFSGTEIAAQLAPYARVTVTLRQPMWFLPRWVRATDGGSLYPLDLVINSRRANNPMRHDPHLFLRRVGGDPGAASPELTFDRGRELPRTIVISDEFLGLVQGEAVTVKRSAGLEFNSGGVIYSDGTRQALDVVILCTGFTSSLPFFDPATLRMMGFDASDQLQPHLLHRSMFHPDLPGLAFIGHYRGPHFPVMELQSRWLARIVSGELPMPDRATMLAGVADERAIRARLPRPQFPHGDLVSLADGLARDVGVYPALAEDDVLRERVIQGPLLPAHYRLMGPHAKPELARGLIIETPAPGLDDPPRPLRPGLGRRVLDLLRGHWAIERQIEPGGHFTGMAAFTQRSDDSLLYRENGRLVLDDGITLEGENSYVYALRNGDIEVSFADGPSRGVHFIDISLPADQPDDAPIVSIDRHLCRLDTYDATFCIENAALFTITYVVSGPKKSYVSRSAYRRMGPGA
jgi:dimethylaniline monooxygenase (N-oxide forming)